MVLEEELFQKNVDLLKELGIDRRWLFQAWYDYNKSRSNTGIHQRCNPLLSRLILDYFAGYEYAPSILELCRYYRVLHEATRDGWDRRRKAITGEEFAAFHSTLAELAVHKYLASCPGVGVRFIEPTPGGKPTADYKVFYQGQTIDAELKSILSDQVRAEEKVVFAGVRVDPKSTRKILNKYADAKHGQVRLGTRGLVFVDATLCDELYVFLGLPQLAPRVGFEEHALSLLSQVGTAGIQRIAPTIPLVLVFLDHYRYRIRNFVLVPVNTEQSV